MTQQSPNETDFRRLTAAALEIYRALRRARTLSEDGQQLFVRAQDLLRRVAIAYVGQVGQDANLPTTPHDKR